MDQSSAIRRSTATIARRSRSRRRRAPFVFTVLLAVLSWMLIGLAWWAATA